MGFDSRRKQQLSSLMDSKLTNLNDFFETRIKRANTDVFPAHKIEKMSDHEFEPNSNLFRIILKRPSANNRIVIVDAVGSVRQYSVVLELFSPMIDYLDRTS